MNVLGIKYEELIEAGAGHTAAEIFQQPLVWRKIWNSARENEIASRLFLQNAVAHAKRIIITGAGTSAYIGLSLKGVWQRNTGIITEPIATTDLITHPHDYFKEDVPTLLISFARSGNSPESVAALELADKYCKQCYHLIITCNQDGQLANYQSAAAKYVFTLPPEANDKSLAMTSSYTGMLLAGILLAHVNNLDECSGSVRRIISYAETIFSTYTSLLHELTHYAFNRVFFLGSGSFFGTATEAQLKLQEFTSGKIICKSDTYLGFRHGPKIVVDENTLVVYFLSGDEYVSKYEKDLIDLPTGTAPLVELCIAESGYKNEKFKYAISLSDDGDKTDDIFLSVCYILPVQILGMLKALQLGLEPDNPSANGAITRVVEGVNIY